MAISIDRIQCEHHSEALGIGESRPRISWRYSGDVQDWTQRAYELEITRSSLNLPSIYHVESSNCLFVPWPEQPLSSSESVSVRVRAFGNNGGEDTTWSLPVNIETGLLDRESWTCSLIASHCLSKPDAPKQPILFRRTFNLHGSMLKARLYITAQGIYEAHLNGNRIGDHVLAPGWTSYKHHLAYQTFDVTDLLHQGQNAITAEVAEGWFCGRLGFLGGKRNIWGDTIGFIAKLVVTLADNKTITINTDSKWRTNTGALMTSELYDGEVCDLRLEHKGWHLPGFDDALWPTVRMLPLPVAALVAPDGPPVRKIEELEAVSSFKTSSGKLVIDFGQNIVGWVRLSLSGPKGHIIKLLYTEVLEGGEAATRPLRDCKAIDTITLSGEDQMWEPKFTFHGFQYLQIDGWIGCFDLAAVTAIVVHTDMEQTGWFECSNPLLNKLHHNVRWGMRGNFLGIPTDCPQRDERLGWTGDIHVFGPTANYLYDTCGMLKSWVKDLAAEQMEDGSGVPPFFCPNVFLEDPRYPTAIWGDVVVGLPWQLYSSYGDREILIQQLKSMQAWVDHGIVRDAATGLWKEDSYQFGDWLDPKAPPDEPGNSITDPILVANAYLVHITSLMHKISLVLGLDELTVRYGDAAVKLKKAFQNRYISSEGRVVSDSQTALALAIHFQLFACSAQESAAASRLKALILRNSRFKIATGFAGTPLIGHALSRVGLSQLFYRMLYHRKAPSWLYQVTMGATTIWERWDSMLPDGSINPGEMTSFNHYALGAVADWMHRNIAGLSSLETGWRCFRVAPVPGGDLSHASTKFLSPYGMITASWKIDNGKFSLTVCVPPNTHAEVVLPGRDGADVAEVGSGKHEFEVAYKLPPWPPLPIYPQYYPHDDDVP